MGGGVALSFWGFAMWGGFRFIVSWSWSFWIGSSCGENFHGFCLSFLFEYGVMIFLYFLTTLFYVWIEIIAIGLGSRMSFGI